MARRSEHSLEEIKEMVLNAAESIVVEGGGAALTMRKIAMEIGYTVGSIYMVFDNMSDLILHINARTLDGIAAELEQAPDCDTEQWLDQVAKLYLRYATINFNRWSLIFEHNLPKGAKVPEWYQVKIERVFRKFETQFAKLASGRTDAENKQAARALWGGIHGISMLALSGKLDIVGVEDVEKSLELLVRNFISGWMQQHSFHP
jgi:AcrR family transcriptional regulator